MFVGFSAFEACTDSLWRKAGIRSGSLEYYLKSIFSLEKVLMTSQIPVLLDTDIGSDIDDAVALAYLLRQPRCELLGITTVSGEPEKRAALASSVLHAAGRTEIPVHVGIEAPLLRSQNQPKAPQAEALTDDWVHDTYEKRVTAIEFLRETIRSRPGEIVLMPIGPLTNIAVLFAIDPEIPSLLKGITMMGGLFYGKMGWGGAGEWNIVCDPHAAAKVFAAPVKEFTMIGLDVTVPCTLPAEECRTRFAKAGGALAPVAAMAEVWFRERPYLVFHDPLAAACLFEPSLCTYEDKQIVVDLHSLIAQGQTLIVPHTDITPHHIAKTVDTKRFFDHYFETVGG